MEWILFYDPCCFGVEIEQLYFADEWDNFLERIGRRSSTEDAELQENSSDSLELRFWVSYRGQTLARTGYKFLANPICLSLCFHLTRVVA